MTAPSSVTVAHGHAQPRTATPRPATQRNVSSFPTGIRARSYLPSPAYDSLFECRPDPVHGAIVVMRPGSTDYDKHYWEPVPPDPVPADSPEELVTAALHHAREARKAWAAAKQIVPALRSWRAQHEAATNPAERDRFKRGLDAQQAAIRAALANRRFHRDRQRAAKALMERHEAAEFSQVRSAAE